MNIQQIKDLFKFIARGGACTDSEFDRVFPQQIRHLSYNYWSTFELSVKAAILACHKDNAKVLDVGSGSGKFCLVGSLVTQGQFHGIEKRKYLVDAARKLGKLTPEHRAHFILGDLAELDWTIYDTLFMFNPIHEYKSSRRQMDSESQYDMSAYKRYNALIAEKLDQMLPGSRLIAVCQSDLKPKAYKKIHCSMVDGLFFDVWQKE